MSGPTVPSEPRTRCPHCPEQHPNSYTHCPNSGKSLTVGSALIGRVIAGRYRIVGQLGEGGMGEVFVADHLLVGRKVAIKRLHPELASDERAVQRFQREARAAAATGHEHIVEVLDLGYADDNAPYLVMEYLRGQSLAELLKRETRLMPQRACHLLGQVLAALEAVHRHDIVHRDLKPDNIFITRRPGVGEFVKVLDFGISKMKEENGEALQLTRTGMMMGTPFYMSPEQARGLREVDHRVDLYSVGVMLYECLTGRLPFSSDNYHALLQQILRTEPRKPSELSPHVDAALDAVSMRAIGKDPDLRFASASEFAAALAPFGAMPIEPPEAPRRTVEPPPSAPSALQPKLAPRATTVEEAVAVAPPSSRPSIEVPIPDARTQRATPRYYFASSDDWQPERARPGTGRSPMPVARELTPAAMPPPPRISTPSPAPEPTVVDTAAAVFAPTLARADAALRGSWFVAAIEHLQTVGGPKRMEQIASRLPPQAAERIGGVILPMAWLPLGTFELLIRAAGDGDALAQAIGRAIAERELTTTHRLFVQTATPQACVERFPHLFKLYHLRGVATIGEQDPQGVRFVLDLGVPEPLVHLVVVSAFLHRMLEICGGREVRTSVVGCRGRGDERSMIACRFR